MTESEVTTALAALAHPQRLRVFRALVVAGSAGALPSHLAEQLAVARNTLSFHLKELAHAHLVTVEQQGRNWIYRAHFGHMNALIAYLTEQCCAGTPCLPVLQASPALAACAAAPHAASTPSAIDGASAAPRPNASPAPARSSLQAVPPATRVRAPRRTPPTPRT